MTNPVQIPLNHYVGNGSKTSYAFTFYLIEPVDLIVLVDNVLQINYSDYTIRPDYLEGGYIDFTVAPVDVSDILIYRRTTKSQNVDYESYTSFPADTHEWNLDKITKILQELIVGVIEGIDGDGNPFRLTFDLSATPYEEYVRINNSGGTDADIPSWVNATLAGVYYGETVAAASLPAADSATTKPDGYIWLGI